MPQDDIDIDETDAGGGDDGDDGDPPEVAAAPAPRRSKKKTGANGVAAPPPPKEVLAREAVLLWPQLLHGKIPQAGKTAYDVRIQVFQMDPPAPQGDMIYLGTISGGNVIGTSETPSGQALLDYVINYFHINRAAGQGSVKYQLRFIWAQDSSNFARGDIILPGLAEINQLRQSDANRRRASGEVGAAFVPPQYPTQTPPGFGAQPQYPPQALPYVVPSYPPPNDNSPMMLQMMREMWEASMQQRAPVITPAMMAGMAAPPPTAPTTPPLTKADVASTVAETLIALGLVKAPQAADVKTVAQPPASSTPTAAGKMEAVFGRVIDSAMAQFISGVEKSIKQSITGIGAPPIEPEEPEPTEPPEPPDDGKPWKSIKVSDAKWSNGSPIFYTPDKESDSLFTKEAATGFLLENPIFAEKGMEMMQNLGQAAAEALKRVAAPTAAGVGGAPARQIPAANTAARGPQVVDETPPGAADATPRWKEG